MTEFKLEESGNQLNMDEKEELRKQVREFTDGERSPIKGRCLLRERNEVWLYLKMVKQLFCNVDVQNN